jgi:hypothetical protein
LDVPTITAHIRVDRPVLDEEASGRSIWQKQITLPYALPPLPPLLPLPLEAAFSSGTAFMSGSDAALTDPSSNP